jgi:DNA-binding HxlR family transcriptional regulator
VGFLERLIVDDNPPRTEYQLTHRGQRLRPVMLALALAR